MSTATETNHFAETAATTEPSVPAIQHLITMWVDSKGKFSKDRTEVAIHDVVRVVEGSLTDALPLLPYRLNDVFTLFNAEGILRKTDAVTSQLAKRPKILTGSVVVAHEDTLYGVVIKDSVAQVIGPIRHVATSIHQNKAENCLVLGKSGPVNLPNLVDSRKVIYDPERHVLVVVPLGGYCFVQFSDDSDTSGDEDTGREANLPGLALLMGTSFLLLENMDLKWNRYKNAYEQELAPWTLNAGQVLFMYAGGCVIDHGVYTIHGHGPRPSNYNEAYYYAMMHVGESFQKVKPATA